MERPDKWYVASLVIKCAQCSWKRMSPAIWDAIIERNATREYHELSGALPNAIHLVVYTESRQPERRNAALLVINIAAWLLKKNVLPLSIVNIIGELLAAIRGKME